MAFKSSFRIAKYALDRPDQGEKGAYMRICASIQLYAHNTHTHIVSHQ